MPTVTCAAKGVGGCKQAGHGSPHQAGPSSKVAFCVWGGCTVGWQSAAASQAGCHGRGAGHTGHAACSAACEPLPSIHTAALHSSSKAGRHGCSQTGMRSFPFIPTFQINHIRVLQPNEDVDCGARRAQQRGSMTRPAQPEAGRSVLPARRAKLTRRRLPKAAVPSSRRKLPSPAASRLTHSRSESPLGWRRLAGAAS